jgi:ATP-dependent Clp protease ATP-binding subunit ClpA
MMSYDFPVPSSAAQYCINCQCAFSAVQIIGRSDELQRVCQILSRRKKNNPIILGEPGVGKTAIAAGLAYIIAKEGAICGVPLPDFFKVLPVK